MPIIDQVTIGVRMRGLSSEMGNMRLSPHRSPGENTLGIWPCEAHSLESPRRSIQAHRFSGTLPSLKPFFIGRKDHPNAR